MVAMDAAVDSLQVPCQLPNEHSARRKSPTFRNMCKMTLFCQVVTALVPLGPLVI
jgi:hypothetical protein